MWKALSLAVGLTLVMVGVELFFVQELEVRKLRNHDSAQSAAGSPFQPVSFSGVFGQNGARPAKTILVSPQDWMPWSLLAVGSIIVIYTFTIPGRRLE